MANGLPKRRLFVSVGDDCKHTEPRNLERADDTSLKRCFSCSRSLDHGRRTSAGHGQVLANTLRNEICFCVRTFMKRPVKLPVPFERSTSLSDTPPVSPRRRSTSDRDRREWVNDRTSSSASTSSGEVARWFTLLYALVVQGALLRRRMRRFEGGAALSHGVRKQPGSDARSLLQLDDLSVNG